MSKFKTCNFVKNYVFSIELLHLQVQYGIVSMQGVSSGIRSAYKIQISKIIFMGSLNPFYIQQQDPISINIHTKCEARYMNGMGFEMSGRTSVPKSPFGCPPPPPDPHPELWNKHFYCFRLVRAQRYVAVTTNKIYLSLHVYCRSRKALSDKAV